MDTSQLKKLRLDHPEEQPQKKTRWRWLLLLGVLILGGSAVALFWQHQRQRNEGAPVVVRQKTEVPNSAHLPTAGVFTAAGYLETIPPYPITVSGLIGGRVDQFDILEGTPVKAGDVLAKLNSKLQEKRIAELEAELAVNAAKLAQAERVLSRTQQLTRIGSVPAKELERAKAEATIAKAEESRLQAALDLAKWQLENTVVRAPVDGVVFERLTQVGEFISPETNERKGAGIVTLYDPVKIQAWVDVNQRDAGRISLGQTAEVSLDAEPGKTYQGRVLRIQPRASLQKNTVQVKVSIENPSPMLRPDMSAKVTFFPAGNQSATARP